MPRAGDVAIELLDLAGRRVLARRVTAVAGTQTFSVPAGGLASGVYVVRVASGGGATSHRVVVVQ
jgi:hypothetical protein